MKHSSFLRVLWFIRGAANEETAKDCSQKQWTVKAPRSLTNAVAHMDESREHIVLQAP